MVHIYEKRAGLYVHIPFCLKKCHYCDFYSTTDLSQFSRFLAALRKEMQLSRKIPLVFDTLYVGGGTPSMLTPIAIKQLIEWARRYFRFTADSEITIEVNPGTVTRESLGAYRDFGVNRISIGAQSFDDANLRFLGRAHRAEDANVCVEWAREAGFDNLGLDLIFGMPGQDRSNWLNDLRAAVHFEPEHLACYMLTCESGTPLDKDVKSGRIRLAEEAMVLNLFDTAIDYLIHRNFIHYEVSNFARMEGADGRPRTSRHNLKYWLFAPYIGLGPSAHSFFESQRYWNHRCLSTYIGKIEAGKPAIAQIERLTREQMIIESIYLGLRTTEGIDLGVFNEKFDIDFIAFFGNAIDQLKMRDMIRIGENHCALTRKGLLFVDSIAAMFIDRDLVD
jgi:oxygen-independent coproporphyrinogen-3 oxidase